MAKSSGGTRMLKPMSREYRKRMEEVVEMRLSGKYASVEMSERGGYVAIEVSSMKHKPEELEAAQILADKGYKVILKDEAPTEMNLKTVDGYVFSMSFEQRTPMGSTVSNCQRALNHAREKKADIALIYDKYHNYHRKTVEEGIKQYEENETYRFKQIIVVTSDRKIHRHIHND